MSTHKLTPDERAAILRAYLRGETLSAIAAKYGVVRSYPRTLARRRGYEPRQQASSA